MPFFYMFYLIYLLAICRNLDEKYRIVVSKIGSILALEVQKTADGYAVVSSTPSASGRTSASHFLTPCQPSQWYCLCCLWEQKTQLPGFWEGYRQFCCNLLDPGQNRVKKLVPALLLSQQLPRNPPL